MENLRLELCALAERAIAEMSRKLYRPRAANLLETARQYEAGTATKAELSLALLRAREEARGDLTDFPWAKVLAVGRQDLGKAAQDAVLNRW